METQTEKDFVKIFSISREIYEYGQVLLGSGGDLELIEKIKKHVSDLHDEIKKA